MNSSRRRPLLVAIAVLSAVASVAAVSTARGSESRSLAGGTYRVGLEGSYDLGTDSFDPTGESDAALWGIYSNLLVRTLVGYRHVAGPAGNKLVPDLAVSLPTPASGGRTYTFELKTGIRFGPPVDREIRSSDLRYAVERLARPKNGGRHFHYFRVIEGFDAYRAGRAKSISGIATPDAKTITFTLTRPTGDFLYRLTLPATAPIPPEVGKCFEGKPGRYGSDVISSGPYMIEGSDRIRIGTCSAVRPMSGISDEQLSLVRNPRYDAKTDSPAARESNPDRFVFVVIRGRPATAAVIKKLAAGELEDAILQASPKVVGKYAADAGRRGLVKVNPTQWLFFVSMNLTQPPFDDVHVRRAMSWLVDRAALREQWGGAMAGSIPQHILPDELLGNQLKSFAPFKTPGDHGDLAKAKAEMAKSKYANKAGVCTAGACKGVSLAPLTNNDIAYAAGQRMAPIIKASGARIGITFRINSRDYDKFFTPSRNIPISPSAFWYRNYPDAANFVDPLLTGATIFPSYNLNTSLVGITPAQAGKLGVKGTVNGVPSIDADVARCNALTGAGRTGCFARLDRKLSTEVVPWIPFLWRNRITVLGPSVAKWEFDQSTGMTSFAHVAVKG